MSETNPHTEAQFPSLLDQFLALPSIFDVSKDDPIELEELIKAREICDNYPYSLATFIGVEDYPGAQCLFIQMKTSTGKLEEVPVNYWELPWMIHPNNPNRKGQGDG